MVMEFDPMVEARCYEPPSRQQDADINGGERVWQGNGAVGLEKMKNWC